MHPYLVSLQMHRSALVAIVVTTLMLGSAGEGFAACSLGGSVFAFASFPIARSHLTVKERDQLASIGAQARAERCNITVTAVAPQNAGKEDFHVRFKQSYVAREALAWKVGPSRARIQAMENIARFDVKAHQGQYEAGTVYVNLW